MKKLFVIVFLIPVLAITGCKKSDENNEEASALAQVGTTWTGPGNSSITVMYADGVNVEVTGLYNGYSMSVSGKMSSTGIADYFYSGGDKSKPFTLVNFDDPAGTEYQFHIGSLTVKRTILSKSTSDDYYVPALGLMIKVSEVREDVPEGLTVDGNPAKAKTIYYYVNHKFGVVYVKVITVGGDTLSFPLSYTNAGQ